MSSAIGTHPILNRFTCRLHCLLFAEVSHAMPRQDLAAFHADFTDVDATSWCGRQRSVETPIRSKKYRFAVTEHFMGHSGNQRVVTVQRNLARKWRRRQQRLIQKMNKELT
ncbi:hypothetical protein B0X78_02950 [bacterium AM6]|nr:hypothetical protein B0X78_02950 [bacterium AM6]